MVTIYDVGKLFNRAIQRSATVQTLVNGFRKTGIFPFNPDIFPDHLFAPSITTDRRLPECNTPTSVPSSQQNAASLEKPSTMNEPSHTQQPQETSGLFQVTVHDNPSPPRT